MQGCNRWDALRAQACDPFLAVSPCGAHCMVWQSAPPVPEIRITRGGTRPARTATPGCTRSSLGEGGGG